MSSKLNRSGHSGKRGPSKRVTTVKNEMRSSHFIHEYDQDDHDWQKERKLKVYRSHSSLSQFPNNKTNNLKQKRRQACKSHHEDFELGK
ncbi:hypothetical protein [Mesobacillus jeotgali]|uniref:hypothetical protein n=1 Tax=Mesobacillus jeotgali TaxID=129985 RepID=UPI0009A614F2|nr:hypothetical protein [Mesobacillus jeotgali]